MSTVRPSFAIIGDESLTIACASAILEQNFEIAGLVSTAAPVIAWARDNDVRLLDRKEIAGLANLDYLLSIANLQVLSQQELATARIMAINFHDGPLPELAGVNAPSWAIAQGLTDYAVTWHEMAARVDTGGILVREDFSLESDETAVSLNTKCFHAGFRSFQKLLAQIAAGNLSPVAQPVTATAQYFARWQRPEAICGLSFSQGAEAIDAQLRSMEFGQYSNPIGTAKIALADRLIAVEKAVVLPERSTRPAGTVVEAANNWVQFATSTHDIRLSKLTDLSSDPLPSGDTRLRLVIDCGVAPGDTVQEPDPETRRQIVRHLQSAASAEHYWERRLAGFPLLDLPSSRDTTALQCTVELPSGLQSPHAALAAVASVLGRITRSDDVGLWCQAPGDEKAASGYLLSHVPLTIEVDWAAPFSRFAGKCRQLLDDVAHRPCPPRDLALRSPQLSGKVRELASAPICRFEVSSTPRQPTATCDNPCLVFRVDDANRSLHIRSHAVFDAAAFDQFSARLHTILAALDEDMDMPVGSSPLVTPADRSVLSHVNQTAGDAPDATVHALFQHQSSQTPDRMAVKANDGTLTYRDLDERSDRVADNLRTRGVRRGSLVGVMMGRGIDLLPVMIGILKAGAAYVPLDRNYPENRLQHMIADCRPALIVIDQAMTWSTDSSQMVAYTELLEPAGGQGRSPAPAAGTPSDLMYVIYTSGSTGRPKGVQVRHENVTNFFAGIDERIGAKSGTLLATTSISFDISVLELFWTLCRGFTVVLHDDSTTGPVSALPDQPIGFSLFFWNTAEAESLGRSPYDLTLGAARYADKNGFEAVWTPERHFGDFGGYYPNPSVISAAIAAVTENVGIRAGSCVLPLHHPVRVAEEWAVVDNLSNGRVGVSVASGWNPNDFVLQPDRFDSAKSHMFDAVEQVRALWRGESVPFDGPKGEVNVKSLPRPVQKELPVWVTAAGNPETFRQAGECGAGILTHLLGQSYETVAANIELYRQAYRAGGWQGDGHVSVMVHTFVAPTEAQARKICRGPMKSYLKSSLALIRDAAWQFPTFKKFSEDGERTLEDFFANADPAEVDDLLEFAFERYYTNNSMLGSVDKCIAVADHLKSVGADEIGCLVDFGIAEATVMDHLPHLNEVRKAANAVGRSHQTVSESLVESAVTHLQCTPTRAQMILNEQQAATGLSQLGCLMIGGEPVSGALVDKLRAATRARIFNMYGPTETTIWSTVSDLSGQGTPIDIGTPLRNQSVHVLDQNGVILPPGIAGELAIGGRGVTSGYFGQDELTAARFIEISGPDGQPEIVYRTGDLALMDDHGRLKFLGRNDTQVKLRGFRIELGEIEAFIQRCPGVSAAAAVLHRDEAGDATINAFVVCSDGSVTPESLRAELQGQLPDFMVPNHVSLVPELPFLPNGKLNRRHLEELEVVRKANAELVPPSTDTERALAEIWSSLLKVEGISLTDNFFELGGHSLLAIQAIDAIETRMNVRINPRKILTNTLEQLARDCALSAQTEKKKRPGALDWLFNRRSGD